MQAIIMAGGMGSRLKSITNNEIPKPMAILLGKPILQWQIECLVANNIWDIVIVTGHLGDKIKTFFEDGSKFGVNITYFHEKSPLGTAGALASLGHFIKEDIFLLIFGDVIFDIDIIRMEHYHREKYALATLFVHPNSHPHDSDLVVMDDNGRVLDFDSKENHREGWYKNCVNAGFYILDKQICSRIEAGKKIDLEKGLLLPLIKKGEPVFAYASTEYIKDVGTPDRIIAASNDLERGYVSCRNLQNYQRCIFVDRDGTINQYKGLIFKEEDFVLEQGTVEAVRTVNQSGWLIIVITNQPVVARGLCDISVVEQMHKKLETLLGEKSAFLDDILFCPHHPDKGFPEEDPKYKVDCICRKPNIGMIEKCVTTYNIDLSKSWIVGDTTVDIQTGKNAGLRTALVLTGKAGKDKKYPVQSDITCENLLEAVKHIIKME